MTELESACTTVYAVNITLPFTAVTEPYTQLLALFSNQRVAHRHMLTCNTFWAQYVRLYKVWHGAPKKWPHPRLLPALASMITNLDRAGHNGLLDALTADAGKQGVGFSVCEVPLDLRAP